MMNRLERTEVLIESPPEVARQLADEIIQAHEVIELLAPRQGLAMMKLRESAKNSLFYMGEVLVTEAMVEINGSVGIGLIKGAEPTRARDLAIIDAAFVAELPETIVWAQRLHEEAAKLEHKRNLEHAQLLKTKVSFDTMST